MTITQRYIAPSPALASYDDVDLATGTGIINFYAGMVSGATMGNNTGLLSNQQFWSNQLATAGSTGSSTISVIKNLNFNVTVNRAMNLKGDMVVSIPMYLTQTGGTTGKGRVDLTLKKVAGNTTTIIANMSGAEQSQAAGSTTYFIESGYLSVPATHFKIGDTLRANIISYAYDAGGGTTTIGIGHDPKNRATASGSAENFGSTPSNLILGIPVRIPV